MKTQDWTVLTSGHAYTVSCLMIAFIIGDLQHVNVRRQRHDDGY